MISSQTVALAMRENNPTASTEEISQLHQLMIEEAAQLREQIAWKIRNQWTQEHGRQPDGQTWGQILDRASLDAEEMTISTYLEPLIYNEDQDEDELMDSPHYRALNNPFGWRTQAHHIQASSQAIEVVEELWPDEDAGFTMIAQALMEHRLHNGKDLPANDQHPEYPIMLAMIQQAALELDS